MARSQFPEAELKITGAIVGFFVALLLVLTVPRMIMQSTVYAPGYSWQKFGSIRQGMTPIQVEAVLGPPLKRVSWGGFSDVSFYSDQKTITDNFWRQWVVWKDGKVDFVISDYWDD
jgi:hypothetical protein